MGMNSEMHCGNFSSSEIVALTSNGKTKGSFGKPYYTYIEERNTERELGRVLKNDFSSKDIAWGHLMEIRAFKLLETKYSLISDKTIRHPTISCWIGSPDAVVERESVVGDIKGLQLKAFCQMVKAWEKGGIEAVRNETESGEKFFWQIVSNACLTLMKYGELILYLPYQSELDAIRTLANTYDGPNAWMFKRFAFATDEELPYLLPGGRFKNLYKMRFEIPFLDKQFLHNRVVEAEKELIEFKPLTVQP
jgi:hypothetical protein